MKRWLVVVGTSAGGLDALTRLVAQLPPDFPAPLLIVQHLAAASDGKATLRALQRVTALPCAHARHGDAIDDGHVYLAPPDHHLMVKKGTFLITKGARENGWRPSIDPLFRSAAVAHGSRVIGVVLTGYLDDGTAGLLAIERCGGTCVVQDPADAAYPDMPQNALARVKSARRVALSEMGAVLASLVEAKPGKRAPVPRDIAIEAKIAQRVLSDLPSVEAVGDQVPFNCPGCGGVLWEVKEGDALRYRCHTGHAFTAPVLLAEQSEKIEETLWIALRMFEERRNLLSKMATSGAKESAGGRGRVRGAGNVEIYSSTAERAKEAEKHIERIRHLLRMDDTAGGKGAPAGGGDATARRGPRRAPSRAGRRPGR